MPSSISPSYTIPRPATKKDNTNAIIILAIISQPENDNWNNQIFKVLVTKLSLDIMSYENTARIINDEIYDLVNETFAQEKSSRNFEGRVNFFDTYKDYFVLTDDGSYSIKSREINHKVETLHTSTGAISESFEKFIKPMKFNYSKDIAILDICAGLGYNSSAAIADFMKNSNANLTIDMVEISHATLACGLLVPSPVAEHDITKKAIEEELIRQDYAALSLERAEIPENIDINVFIEDARQTVQKLKDNTYDTIFLDPFSQNMAPELFSLVSPFCYPDVKASHIRHIRFQTLIPYPWLGKFSNT